MTTIDDTLAERGVRYGDFTDHARVAQALQDTMRAAGDTTGWQALNAIQKQALTVIADKIARILTGDPNYHDNWHDIQGYAKLVEDRLPVAESAESAPVAGDGWIEWKGGQPVDFGHFGCDGKYRATEAVGGGWIEWHGSGAPVPFGACVEARARDGAISKGSAATLDWQHRNLAGDIVAYRIVK